MKKYTVILLCLSTHIGAILNMQETTYYLRYNLYTGYRLPRVTVTRPFTVRHTRESNNNPEYILTIINKYTSKNPLISDK